MKRIGFFCPRECLLHDTGRGHPEQPSRLIVIREKILEEALPVTFLATDPASESDLLRAHTEKHVALIRRLCAEGTPADADTPVCPNSWDAACYAAGAGITAAQAILDGRIDSAFCAVRPPGHHAETNRAMGFCLFNNAAVLAGWLQHVGGLSRVAIIDWDVHHGNGTQEIFYENVSVYYASIHQSPLYPGTGFDHERGVSQTNLNIPLPPHSEPETWETVLRERVVPEFQRFNPEFLIVSCGFDAHRLDPLSDQLLESRHFDGMTDVLREVGCDKVISLLEGGYHNEALAESAVAHITRLMEN
ncbi:MAG TPA: histone deacetylase [Candidatus Hydrogenedentes bacterium]|nr:histone deacetylase [Candidatus Hydrogenedentota bacterium]HOL77030.1 histone deacetylase [Candidatus Hydrogenedentota bacterium]HPO85787.1 histone deacetylase [Candidatus Hydrogenedentota bacterium]